MAQEAGGVMMGQGQRSEMKTLGPFNNPFHLIPEEMWRLIFKQLSDENDLISCINAHSSWHAMYESELTTVLFSKVLAALMRQSHSKTWHHSEFQVENMLKCRLVSKSWNESVKIFVQTHPRHFRPDIFDDNNKMKIHPASAIDQLWLRLFPSPERPSRFVDQFENSHPPNTQENPVFTRMVHIRHYLHTVRDRDELQLHCDRTTVLLEKYGRHVWHLKVEVDSFSLRHVTPVVYYNHLQQWLAFMPNLQTLELSFQILVPPAGERDHRDMSLLVSAVYQRPLPEMRNLVSLRSCDLPNPIFHQLIQKCSQRLKHLEVDNRGGGIMNHYRYKEYFNEAVLNDLTELNINVRRKDDLLGLEEIWRKKNGQRWPLRTLFFHFLHRPVSQKGQDDPIWEEWQTTFRLLGDTFGDTLTHLRLTLPKENDKHDFERIVQICQNHSLNLRHLVKLKLELPSLIPMNFLLPMKNSLQELEVVVWSHTHTQKIPEEVSDIKIVNNQKEKIQFNGWLHKMIESNIWEEFVKLKTLKVKILNRDPISYSWIGWETYSYERSSWVQ